MKFPIRERLASINVPLWLNIISLVIICGSLIIAFYYQFIDQELPCPLCLLQRVGMILIGFGFLYNIRFGIKSAHYGLALIGSVVLGVIAARQVSLHIIPGEPGYGSEIFGLHFYTLCFIAAVMTILTIAAELMVHTKSPFEPQNKSAAVIVGRIVSWLFIAIIVTNLVSTILECGGGSCPDNPTVYLLLHH